jgi:signal-transduction protein with cAMP-binding, CBS, and nucleotidyltransferase domain
MALLDPEGRAISDVVVRGFCEGYHLSRDNFFKLQDQYPDFSNYIENVARLRLQKMEDTADEAPVPAAIDDSPIKRRLKKIAKSPSSPEKADSEVATSLNARRASNVPSVSVQTESKVVHEAMHA